MICPNPQLQVQVEVNSIFVTRFLTQGTLMRVGLVGFVIADDFVSFEASFGLRQVPTHPGLLVSFIGRGVPGLHLVDWGIKGGRVRSFLRDAISSFGPSSSLFSHKQFHPEPPRFPRLVLKGFTCCRHQQLHQTHLENSRDNCQDKT